MKIPAALLVLPLFHGLLRAQCELETQELSPPDGQAGDGFAYRVEVSGDVLIVASTFDDDLGLDAGSAYVYERHPALGWVLARKLLASDGAAGDGFSYGVEVDGDTVLISAPNHDDGGGDRGAVYVFRRDQGGAGQWGEVTHFTPPSAGAGARFGYSLDVDGDLLLVGAPHPGLAQPGTAYLYARDAGAPGGWTQQLEFTSDDPATVFGFGHDVSLDGQYLAVAGARSPTLPYADSYVVHLRERDAGGAGQWGEVQRIASPTGTRDLFAYEISLDGERLAVVAPAETDFVSLGALYVYRRAPGGHWDLERRLSAPPEQPLFTADHVDLRGDWLVAGSFSQTVGTQLGAGTTFVFGRDVGGPDAWGAIAPLHDDAPETDAFFGLDFVLQGDELLIGAPGSYSGLAAGELYAYDLGSLARAQWRDVPGSPNPDVLLALTRPSLGTTYSARVDLGAAGRSAAALVVLEQPAQLPLASGSVLLGRRRLALLTGAGPLARFDVPLPNRPGLCGLRLVTQALLTGGGPAPALTNALDLVLGR